MHRHRLLLYSIAVVVATAVVFGVVRRGDDFSRRIFEDLRTQGFPVTIAEVGARYPAVPDALNAYRAVEKPARQVLEYAGQPGWPAVKFGNYDGRSMPRSEESLREWRDGWAPAVAANQQAIAELKRGLTLPLSWNRDWTDGDPFILLPIGMVLHVEPEIAAALGRTDAAVEGITNLLRLSWVGDGVPRHDTIICMNLIRGMALDSLENLLTRGILSDAELRSIDVALRHARREGTLELTYARELAFVEEVVWGNPALLGFPPFPISPSKGTGDRLYKLLFQKRDHRYDLRFAARTLAHTRLPPRDHIRAAKKDMKSFLTDLNRFPSHRFSRLGLYVGGENPSLPERDFNDRARLHAAIVACAVERWRLAHPGRLPGALTELVPGFLDTVPLDPMSGEPLQYRNVETGYWVYGVGANGEENGGARSQSTVRPQRDISVCIDRP